MISHSIIKFAADITNYGLRKNSNYIATCKNKICGDKITVEVEIKRKIIKKMNYETESCVYCQASASLLSKYVKNKETNLLSFALETAKKEKNFRQLFENKGRNNCIMLPFVALKKAINYTK